MQLPPTPQRERLHASRTSRRARDHGHAGGDHRATGDQVFGLVEDIGRERYCKLKQDGFNDLQEWINFFDGFWKTKLKKLESLINQKHTKK